MHNQQLGRQLDAEPLNATGAGNTEEGRAEYKLGPDCGGSGCTEDRRLPLQAQAQLAPAEAGLRDGQATDNFRRRDMGRLGGEGVASLLCGIMSAGQGAVVA